MNICVITAARSEYGLLRRLIFELDKRKDANVGVLVTGAHLEKECGLTLKEIENDGINIVSKIRICDFDANLGVINTMGNAISRIGKFLFRTKPDIVIILGDRYESLAVASACCVLRIPIAHIHGGELTFGAYDDAFRHSITKMSNLHFASCEAYRRRIIQLGEDPETVFNVGALGVENIKSIKLKTKREIEKYTGVSNISRTLLATFHPVTTEIDSQEEQMKALLKVAVSQKEYFFIFTYPNADTGAAKLTKILKNYVKKYPEQLSLVGSLGVLNYLSAMKYCAGVIGNSSSGIIEAPSMKVPTINIGDRQSGRIQAPSIINCRPTEESISSALRKIGDKKFAEIVSRSKNPYYKKDTSKIIADKILGYSLCKNYQKKFFDL